MFEQKFYHNYTCMKNIMFNGNYLTGMTSLWVNLLSLFQLRKRNLLKYTDIDECAIVKIYKHINV